MPGPEWTLYVEGKDDKNAIAHLLVRHGLPWSIDHFVDSGNKTKVLQAIGVSVPAGTGKSLGFILDANGDPGSTWQSVMSRLGGVGVDVPSAIPADGFVGESKQFGARVGVWIMPDNRRSGALEDFLKDLIRQGDRLLPHAEDSTGKAKKLGAQYGDMDTRKAVLHSWLAWQKQPGLPYGSAIRAHYLQVDSVAARQFVAWFGRLFGVVKNGPSNT
jgi:hypothetical protein